MAQVAVYTLPKTTHNTTMATAQCHRLDAFHVRPDEIFGMPQDAHIYAARPLPPVPGLALRSPSSTRSLRTLTPSEHNRRPSLKNQGRIVTTDCVPQSPPAMPKRAAPTHERDDSIDSVTTYRPSEAEEHNQRARNSRSVSFRNFLHRSTFPVPQSAEMSRTASAMSQHSEHSRDSRHDSMTDDAACPAPGSRRPSTLSINTIRSRKHSQESVPTILTTSRPASGRKSVGSGRRWNLFGNAEKEDGENAPPLASPITPPGGPSSELSCHRCYYFSMRNCNGWVMGGAHGDACENCTVSLLPHLCIAMQHTDLVPTD